MPCRVLRRRHVRSDRLQRLLDEANERILELETLRDEMVTSHNQLVAGHNQELNTMRQRLPGCPRTNTQSGASVQLPN